ncbi:PREDICTED: PRUPE_2G180300 [Prunus dulcis]|uniref:PREDICTED: PRUPE_2G180300 n=1 Tax=Prunus dulcis TaxID=3755 RepID=A0A5E4F6L4_PRUDU|nr:PREDICTED: PRUPE_2G180300 [Prunus dulcis]
MADLHSQRRQAITLHVHNSFVFSFNTRLINLARQHLPAPSPHSILVFIVSAVAARLRFPTYSPTNFRLAIIFSALLSVASLLSLLFPDSWHHIPYVIFIFYYLMAEGLGLLQKLCQRRMTRTPTLLPMTTADIHGFAVRDTYTWSFN